MRTVLVAFALLTAGCIGRALDIPCCDGAFSRDPGFQCGPYADTHALSNDGAPDGTLCTCPLTADGQQALPHCEQQ